MLIDLNWNLSGFSVFSLCLTGSGMQTLLRKEFKYEELNQENSLSGL